MVRETFTFFFLPETACMQCSVGTKCDFSVAFINFFGPDSIINETPIPDPNVPADELASHTAPPIDETPKTQNGLARLR